MRPDVAARRRAWFAAQPDLDPRRLVFIDETGASTKMSRLQGRALMGERCRAAVPHGHWKTTTFTGALRVDGMTAPMVLDGPMNRVAFQAYIEQVLVPTLERSDTVIMDNLPAGVAPVEPDTGLVAETAYSSSTRSGTMVLGSRSLSRPGQSPHITLAGNVRSRHMTLMTSPITIGIV